VPPPRNSAHAGKRAGWGGGGGTHRSRLTVWVRNDRSSPAHRTPRDASAPGSYPRRSLASLAAGQGRNRAREKASSQAGRLRGATSTSRKHGGVQPAAARSGTGSPPSALCPRDGRSDAARGKKKKWMCSVRESVVIARRVVSPTSIQRAIVPEPCRSRTGDNRKSRIVASDQIEIVQRQWHGFVCL